MGQYTELNTESHGETTNEQQLIFWKTEREMLDRLYRDRMRDWQRLLDLLERDEPKYRYAG